MIRDLQTEQKIALELANCPLFSRVFCYEEIGSTNDACHALGLDGAAEGTIVLANSQTGGRGRMGRHFYSPQNDGLYMSLLLKPQTSAENFGLITACAAVAVHQAIYAVYGISTDIKWVNDLYFDHKKLCGILAEGHFNGTETFVVLGIGVNLRPPKDGYAPEIRDLATSLEKVTSDCAIDREKLCAEIIRQFHPLYQKLEEREFLRVYRSASCVIGKQVSFIKNGENQTAKAIGVDEDARLLVRMESGEQLALSSGEISLLRPVF